MSIIKKPRAAIYCRVSSDEQRGNTSIGSQEDYALDFCTKKGYVVDKVFTEDYSAKTYDRPEWNKMIAYLKRNKKQIDYLFFYDYSRFGRETAGGFHWHAYLKDELHITPQSLTQWIDYNIPEYVYILGFYLSGPQVENTWRKIKTTNGMIARMKEGKYVHGSMPLGYTKDKNTDIISHTEKAPLIRSAFQLVATGIPVSEVGRRMKALGLDRDCRQSWYKMFRNKFYMGLIDSKMLEEPVQAINMSPIVEKALFERVQAVMDGKAVSYKYNDNNQFPLKSSCRCGYCNGTLSSYTVTKKRRATGLYAEKKTPHRYYICNNKKCRANYSYNKMHASFIELLQSYTIDERLNYVIEGLLSDTLEQVSKVSTQQNAALKKRITETKNRIKSLTLKYIDGNIESDDYQNIKADLQKNIRNSEALLKTEVQLSNPYKKIKKATEMITKTAHTWSESSFDNQIKLQQIMFPEGIMYDKEIDSYRTPRVNRIFTLISSHTDFKSTKPDTPHQQNIGFVIDGSPHSTQIDQFIEDFNNFFKLVS